MKQYVGYIGAFALGVLVTVGVYEVVRVVTNARDALSAASSQMAVDDAVDEGAPKKAVQPVVPGRAPVGSEARRNPRGRRGRKAREQRKQERWAAKSPEERARLQEQRDERMRQKRLGVPLNNRLRRFPSGRPADGQPKEEPKDPPRDTAAK